MKKRRVICAAAILCLLLSGCGGLSLNAPDILSPPKAQGNQAEIQELIHQSAGGSYEMVYPESGAYNSSVIFYDLDEDDEEEAVAMYTCDNENISILIADKKDNDYRQLAEYSVSAPKLDRVEFADFDGDGSAEAIFTCPGTTAALQSLIVVTVGDEVTRSEIPDACAAHLIGDLNGDGRQDLLTLALSDGETLPTARLLIGTESGLAEQSSCEIASDTKEYVSLNFGKISSDVSGAVIDAVDENGEYTTQMICYDNDTGDIINPLYVNNSYSKTKRDADVTSDDIDRDGVIEIPVCSMMGYAQNEESSSVCEKIDWSWYDNAQLALVTKQTAILCDRLGFLLNLAPEHADIVTARYTGENSMSVYLWEYKRNTPERTTKLATVKRYDKSAFDKSRIFETVAGQNNDYVYTYIIEPDTGFYGFTDEEIADNFVLIENQREN